jgi:hypothetical protein
MLANARQARIKPIIEAAVAKDTLVCASAVKFGADQRRIAL